MRTKKSFAAISALALIVLAACGGGGGTTAPANNTGGNTPAGGGTTPTVPGLNQVIARGTSDAFAPTSLTVTVGTTVSFTFESIAHNVIFDPTANGRPDDIPGSNSNTTITRTFNAAGTFSYQCTIHAGMTGTVIVH